MARGTFGAGAVPATGAGTRMMFYPGKAAFRAGQVGTLYSQWGAFLGNGGADWDDANIGVGSVALGSNALASGARSLAIGSYALATGDGSVAIGSHADTKGFRGSVVIGDGCASFRDDTVKATANNQVNIRGCGGIRLFTSQNLSSGVELAPGGSQWMYVSDRNSKENFKSVNSRDVLRKVLRLPITTWNYKSQGASIRHIGAMAQDFKAAFEIGEDDRHISALDPDGVAFAAIQGLNEEMKTENAVLRRQLAALEARLKKLEQTAAPRKARKRK